ncbi:MAG: cyclopropane fatty acyl phospholipid synthase, partial [Gammaproteobacteria bacterium]|nr:cyclopropane fatty acyl phospholipid synthase [Gammaproteobacteria bacterium]
MANAKAIIADLLNQADIQINGSRPWDIQVHDERLYDRVIRQDSLGLGESYMDGWWDCLALDQFFDRVLSAQLDRAVMGNKRVLWSLILTRLFNFQSKRRAFQVAEAHYDLGNDLYEKMLDPMMVYSCAYFKEAKNLNDAQIAKLDLACRKVGLQPGMRLLDIGCGWGSLARFAAERYDVEVVGVTVSKEQLSLAKKRCEGLKVDLRLQDYRELNEQFDRIISIGMFEHVGYRNYHEYMKVAERNLKADGLFLLHTIGQDSSVTLADPWIEKYIFPNGMIPSLKQVAQAAEGRFVLEDLHNFGPDYDKTLMAWHANFNEHWPSLKSQFDERFFRMWNYYL